MNRANEHATPAIRIRSSHHANNRLNRPRPLADDEFEVFSSTEGFCAYVRPEVLKFIADHARRNGKKETIGLLCGRICIDPGKGTYTLIMGAGDARQGEFKSTEGDVQLLASGHAKVRRRLIAANPDREVIGWYHTHPTYPPRFSHVDFREQETWSDKDHIGIVYSGESLDEPFGVYRGPTGILLRPTQLRRLDEPDRNETPASPPLTPHPTAPESRSLFLTPARQSPKAAVGQGACAPRFHWAGTNALMIAMFIALVILGGIGFFLTWRAVSSIQSQLDDLALAKKNSETPGRTTNPVPTPNSAGPAPTILSGPTSNPVSGEKPLDAIDLRPPAKPLFNEPRPARQQDSTRLRTTKKERDDKRDKKSNDNKRRAPTVQAKPTVPGEQILPASKTAPQATPKPQL